MEKKNPIPLGPYTDRFLAVSSRVTIQCLLTILCILNTLSLSLLSDVGEGGECQEGWKYGAGSCYHIFTSADLQTWEGAEHSCQSLGAHLAMLETRQEYEMIAYTWCKSTAIISFIIHLHFHTPK